jgi:gluconate 5-dehydrogenase
MAADLAETPIRVNLLLPGGATATGMVPEESLTPQLRQSLIDPAVMGPPLVWLASEAGADAHDERIVAVEFESWLAARSA